MARNIPVNLPEGYVEFFKHLESWQNEQEIRLKQIYAPEKINAISLIGSNNNCLMKIHNFFFDPEHLKNNFLSLLELLKVQRENIKDSIDRLFNIADQLDFNILPGMVLDENQPDLLELAEQLGVSGDLLIFALDHSMRPFLRIYAQPLYEEFTHEDFSHWHQSANCPFCGSKSDFSRLRMNDGKRFMFCDHCFTEWAVHSLCCIYCGNDEPHTISYINIENDSAYQIYTCDKCKGYLKTYDEREGGETTDLFIANIETIYLDMLAQQKGYSKHNLITL